MKELLLLAVGYLAIVCLPILSDHSHGLRAQAVPPPLPYPLDGPIVQTSSVSSDHHLTNLVAEIVERRTTNWYGGNTRKAAEITALYNGTPLPIGIYEQFGQVTISHVAFLTFAGKKYEFPLRDWQHAGTNSRLFRLEGTNQIILTNTPP